MIRKVDHDPYQITEQIYILGDSIMKHVKGYNISSLLENYKVYINDFNGARIRSIKDSKEGLLPDIKYFADILIMMWRMNGPRKNILVLALLFSKLLSHNYRPK